MKNEPGFSDIVGGILIICLVVVLAIVIIGLFFGNLHFQQRTAYILPEVTNQSFYGKNIIIVFSRGGETMYLNSTAPGQGVSLLGIYLDTKTNISARVVPNPGVSVFRPGTTLYIYNTTAGFRMTASSTMLQYANATNISLCPLSIRLVDENAKLQIGQWNWTDCVPTGPQPTVSAISNATGYRGWPVIESITGTNFLTGASAKFNRTGYADIPASSCTYVSSTRLICTFDLLEKTAATYNVVVTNPDGRQGMRANAFVLSSPNPTVTSSTPASGNPGTAVVITSLTGTYFQPGAKVDYYLAGYRINLSSVSVVSPTKITGTLNIPLSAPAGSYGVNVTNTDNKSGQTAGRFTINNTVPSITARAPTNANRGWPVAMTITGTNFVTGATVRLNRTGYADIPGTSVNVNSATQITCSFSLLGAQPGLWNLSVTNPDGRTASQPNYFTVNNNAPTVTSITPNTWNMTIPVSITNLAGTNFQPDSTVQLVNGSEVISASGTVVQSGTKITCTFDLSSATKPKYSVVVINWDGKTGTGANLFTVRPRVIADFSWVQVLPLTNHRITFTDLSSGGVNTRDWDFGDGTAHGTTTPVTHTYTSAGAKTVTLTVTRTADGEKSVKTISVPVA